MRTYRELFAVHEFRAIFIAQCLANAAAAAGSLALGTVTYAATGNAALTGLSMFGGPLIRLAASWFTSSAADLLRPRQALMAVAAVTGAADLLQALPRMPWGARLAFLALPWIAMAATSGSMLALVSDILPKDSYVFGRATINVAVGGMQVAGYGLGGLLLVALTTSGLFLAAAGAAAVALVVVYLGIGDHPPRVTGHSLMRRSHEVNRALLGSPLLRPVFLAGCLPNGLVVGCESLFVPFGAHAAGYLLAVTAAGMLAGDILVGRVLPAAARTWLVEPLRFLLAAPYVAVPAAPAAARGADPRLPRVRRVRGEPAVAGTATRAHLCRRARPGARPVLDRHDGDAGRRGGARRPARAATGRRAGRRGDRHRRRSGAPRSP